MNISLFDKFFRLKQYSKLDYFIAVIIFISSIVYVYPHISKSYTSGYFYQSYFAPAVMSACGRGYVNLELNPTTTDMLRQFLLGQVDTIQCDVLEDSQKQIPLNNFQIVHRYLLQVVSAIWALSGVSWNALLPLLCGLFATTASLAYLLIRQVAPWPLAVVGAWLFASSDQQLAQLPHLRDYAKVPFMLSALLGCFMMVSASKPVVRAWVAAFAGAVIGVGLGIRFDIVIFIPLIYIVVLFFIERRFDLSGMVERFKLIFLISGVIMLAGGSILMDLQAGKGNTFHVLLLGLADQFTLEMGLVPAQELLAFYNDFHLLLNVSMDASSSLFHFESLSLSSQAYEAAAMSYWLKLVSYFPADMMLNGLGATSTLMASALDPADHPLKKIVVISACFVLILWSPSLRLKYCLLLFLTFLYLGSVASLQFHPRHVSYISVLSYMLVLSAMTVVFYLAIRASLRLYRKPTNRSYGTEIIDWCRSDLLPGETRRKQLIILLSLCLLTPLSFYLVLLEVQNARTVTLQNEYARLDVMQQDMNFVGSSNESTLTFSWGSVPSATSEPTKAAYLTFDFQPSECQLTNPFVSVNYQSVDKYNDFSKRYELDLSQPKRYFLPIYKTPYGQFSSLSFEGNARGCVGLTGILAPSGHAPLSVVISAPLDGAAITPLPSRKPALFSKL